MKIINKFKLSRDYEFTVEVNPENLDKEKILLLRDSNVNRISMGIESTNNSFLKYFL